MSEQGKDTTREALTRSKCLDLITNMKMNLTDLNILLSAQFGKTDSDSYDEFKDEIETASEAFCKAKQVADYIIDQKDEPLAKMFYKLDESATELSYHLGNRLPKTLEILSGRIFPLKANLRIIREMFSLTPKTAPESPKTAPERGSLLLPPELNTDEAQKICKRAIEKGWMKQEGDRLIWLGIGKGKNSQLAYLWAKILGCEYTDLGLNRGNEFPSTTIGKTFGVTNLANSLIQAMTTKKTQIWRAQIDSLFD